MIYGFIGMGLMGGSLAKAVRKYVVKDGDKIYGYDKRKSVLEDAMLDGTLDAMFVAKDFPDSALSTMLLNCDLVYVCLYPEATLEFILRHQNDFKSDAIITDIAGVKQKLCAGLDKYFTRSDVTVIPGHPMAGSEREGYTHSNSEIFKGRNYIFITYKNHTIEEESQKRDVDPKKLEVLKSLARKIGFTNIIETTPKNHDHKITFTSQLCHVIASALVDSAEDTSITDFGGGSFEDLTRIAMINAPLWAELFTADKKELLDHIESFENSLDVLKKTIENEECENIKNILENVRKKRIEMATH
ncbi:MAG: hypothetical protein BKP49_00310 [Treponema sp. CETP13]|nr:MAG: hypothetical protein BKP49_00310 [Treponema sp. CETP13]